MTAQAKGQTDIPILPTQGDLSGYWQDGLFDGMSMVTQSPQSLWMYRLSIPSADVQYIPALHGGYWVRYSDIARDLAYDDSVAPATGSTNVQGAIDALKAGGGGSAPSGTNGVLQFANPAGTALASDPILWWEDNLKRLGVGVSATPGFRLHVSANADTILPPTSVAFATSLESPTHPAASINASEVIGPDDPTSAGGTINNGAGSGAWTATGIDWSVNVYTYLEVLGVPYLSAAPSFLDFGTDDSSGNPLTLSVSWTSATIGDGYVIQVLQNGGSTDWFQIPGLVSSSATLDPSNGTIAQPATFASIAYPYITPSTPGNDPSALFSAYNSNNAGVFGPADGSNYNYEVIGYINAQGLRWTTSGSTGAVSYTDPNDGTTNFSSLLSWSDNGGCNGFFVRRSINGGAWEYTDVGATNGYEDDGFTDDATVAARWGVTYAGVASQTHNYVAYGFNTSPSTYYDPSSAPTASLVVSDNPATGYAITLAIDTGLSPAVRVLGSNQGLGALDEHFDVSGGTITVVDGPGSWSAGAVVAPNHVGVLSSGQTYRAQGYSYSSSVPPQIYSATHTDASLTFPNDGAYRLVAINVVAISGPSQYKILLDTGAGFTTGQIEPAAVTTIALGPGGAAFADGTTVTPTATPSTAGQFESGAAATTDRATVIAHSTVSNGSPRFALTDNSNAEIAALGFNPGSNSAFLRCYNNVELWPSNLQQYRFALSTAQFNLLSFGGYTWDIRAQGGQDGVRFQSSGPPSFIVGDLADAGTAALVVSPIFANGNAHSLFVRRGASGGSGSYIRCADLTNTPIFEISSDGNSRFGFAGTTAAQLNILPTTANTPHLYLQPRTLVGSPVDGNIEHDNTAFWFTQSGGRFRGAVYGAAPVQYAIPAYDGNGNLVPSGLGTLGGTTLTINYSGGVEFKCSATFDSGRTLTLNSGGSLALNGSANLQVGAGGILISTLGALTLQNGSNVVAGTTTGTKLGTATTQKLGFWNATPVVQPTALATTAGFTANTGTPMLSGSTSTGGTGASAYTFGDLVRVLKSTGLIAA